MFTYRMGYEASLSESIGNTDPICNVVKFGRGFGVPPSENFIRTHVATSENVNEADTGSDMDCSVASSLSDGDFYHGSIGTHASGIVDVNMKQAEEPSFSALTNEYSFVRQPFSDENPSCATNASMTEDSAIPSAPLFDFTDNNGDTAALPNDSMEEKPPERESRTDIIEPSGVSSRFPTFHASDQGPWCSVISYDACVRLCLNSWAKGCTDEAPYFLNNECAVLRKAFCLQNVLLQPEEELLAKQTSEFVAEGAAAKHKRTYGKMKVQVRKVKIGLEQMAGCNFSNLKTVLKINELKCKVSYVNASLYSGWKAAQLVRVTPHLSPNGTFSQHSVEYMRAGAQYVKDFAKVFKSGMSTVQKISSGNEIVQESYACMLRLKSILEDDVICMHPGSGESHVFFPENHNDDLIIDVRDSKGRHCGRVVAQVAEISDDPSDKIRWWPMYQEPEHELVGRIQLYINYSNALDEGNYPRCGGIAETLAYDLVLEVAMKTQQFQRRNLTLHGQWKWLVTEFASYFGVSDAYTKLRYLTYVMDVATPTKDCLDIVYEFLQPVLMTSNRKTSLSHQENRLLGEIEDQVLQILSVVFENYKSLDESSYTGMLDVYSPPTGVAAPVLAPAVKLYSLLHDISTPEAQLKLCKYFQAAARKRSRRHLSDTDEFISKNAAAVDANAFSCAYRKMTALVANVKLEILTDLQLNDQNILPSFLDLPNLCASIYSVDLSTRLRSFLVAMPPTSPCPPVADLVIASADFQRDISSWNINVLKGGVNAKELFHLYIHIWIQDKRNSLLESCKAEKVRYSGIKTKDSTTPFVDDVYNHLKTMLNEYEVVMCRWPEYALTLEMAIADVEKAIFESLDKQYADVLAPINAIVSPKIFGLNYVKKLAKRSMDTYFVPDELGILLNSIKKMLDVHRPRIEFRLKSWASSIPDNSNTPAGDSFGEITVLLRSKFRSYLQGISEKFIENTRSQNPTKLKRIIEDSKDNVAESDMHEKMRPLKDLVVKTIEHLPSVVDPSIFVAVCRGFWDRMGQEILRFLQVRGENRTWYKGARIALSILDDLFASEMRSLMGGFLTDKDLESPRFIKEARSLLFEGSVNSHDNTYYC